MIMKSNYYVRVISFIHVVQFAIFVNIVFTSVLVFISHSVHIFQHKNVVNNDVLTLYLISFKTNLLASRQKPIKVE